VEGGGVREKRVRRDDLWARVPEACTKAESTARGNRRRNRGRIERERSERSSPRHAADHLRFAASSRQVVTRTIPSCKRGETKRTSSDRCQDEMREENEKLLSFASCEGGFGVRRLIIRQDLVTMNYLFTEGLIRFHLSFPPRVACERVFGIFTLTLLSGAKIRESCVGSRVRRGELSRRRSTCGEP
jgi:hypothetical protein